ncbi:DUF2298 domain-containing protein [Natrinema salsiterrestre]|uniref:DUF2298 domain-containing protein n=1 Tax=Natrinema salsiterrestre TaxID=2950540 RepID=A0A9Q4Q133_9EURY|nr:DUF2298 domain-containing protein [Natrinema salsiterrestre]MDF9746759.1 DUF2298 domain-containing protein [Natrinema salsiterrestre]
MIGELTVVARWFAVLLVLFGLGLPLSSALFASVPGRGAGFALPVSLTIVGLLVFWFGHLRFSHSVVLLAIGILTALGGYRVYRDGVDLIDRRATAESVVVFSTAFALLLGILSLNPSIMPSHEHFLDIAILQSLLEGNTLPPEDAWFAGEPVRYHYGGQLLTAILIELTGISPQYGYNLAVATFYALLVTGSYELAGSIAATKGRSRRLGGLLGAFFVGIASNLFVPLILITTWLPNELAAPIIAIFSPHMTDGRAALLRDGFARFRYDDPVFILEEGLTSFPFLAGIHSELHPHLMSGPFLVLIIGLLYAYFTTPSDDHFHRRLLLIVALPLGIAMTTLIDTWTLATSVGFVWLTVTFGTTSDAVQPVVRRAVGTNAPDWVTREVSTIYRGIVSAILVGVLSVVCLTPFFGTIVGGGEGIALVSSDQRTTVPQLVILYGAFVTITVGYLLAYRQHLFATNGGVIDQRNAPSVLGRELDRRKIGLIITGLLSVFLWVALDLPAAILFGPLLYVSWIRARATGEFSMVLLIGVVGILLTIEFVYLDDMETILVGRTNTVFRAYFQTWIVWGAIAGVFSLQLLDRNWLSSRKAKRTATVALVTVVLLTTSIYGVLVIGQFVEGATEPPDTTGYYTTDQPGLNVSGVHEPTTYDGADFVPLGDTAIRDGDVFAANNTGQVWSGPYAWLYPGVYEVTIVVNATGDDDPVGGITVKGQERMEHDFEVLNGTSVNKTDGYERISLVIRVNQTRDNVVFRGYLQDENATMRLESVTVTPLETLAGRSNVDIDDEDPTLDGHLYAKAIHPAEMDAIDWLGEHVDGQPTLASAPGGRWRWDSAPSSLTGIPTVVGWEHQRVYRGETAYYERTHDVDALYQGTPAERVDILEKYDVQYVYVGPPERDRYGEVRPFTELEGVSIAYENDAVTIYEIDHDELEYDGTYEIDTTYRYEPETLLGHPPTAELEDGRLVATGARDFAWYGPRDLFHPGTYEVTYYLDVSGGTESDNGAVAVDTTVGMIRSQTEAEVLANQTVNETDGLQAVTQEFDLEQTRGDVEFRGRLLDPTATVELAGIDVVREDGLGDDDPRRVDPDALVAIDAGERTDDGIVARGNESNESQERAWAGPYEAFGPETYGATFELETAADSDDESISQVGVTRGWKTPSATFETLETAPIEAANGSQNVTTEFRLNETTTDVGFEGIVGPGNGAELLESVVVERTGPAANSTSQAARVPRQTHPDRPGENVDRRRELVPTGTGADPP